LGADTLRGPTQVPFNGKVNYTHLMWIDSDMVFKPEDLDKLLAHDKDIVSGVYLMEGGSSYATVKEWDEEFFQKNGSFQFLTPEVAGTELMEVAYSGFGFMLIKHGVFEALEYPWFRPIFYNIGDCMDFCAEDVGFCRTATEKGFKIWVDPSVKVGHEKSQVL
jgi:hypothetical protein